MSELLIGRIHLPILFNIPTSVLYIICQLIALEMICISYIAAKKSLNILIETMANTLYDAYKYFMIPVCVFGILGNILVSISILKQKSLSKNNYYFLVLQLAICDLEVLIMYFFEHICIHYLGEPHFLEHSVIYCGVRQINAIFRCSSVGMMLIISLLRYRATVHPLKPAISRRKLKNVCSLVYIFGLVGGYGTYLPTCFVQPNSIRLAYTRFLYSYLIFILYFIPTMFMAVVYYNIGRALVKQNKYIKRACASTVRRNASSSSFSIMRYIRNRRTFLVCIITVLCYGVGNIPTSIYLMLELINKDYLLVENTWFFYLANFLRAAGSHAINPLIYGVLDKKLFTFWKLCKAKKNVIPHLRQRENETSESHL